MTHFLLNILNSVIDSVPEFQVTRTNLQFCLMIPLSNDRGKEAAASSASSTAVNTFSDLSRKHNDYNMITMTAEMMMMMVVALKDSIPKRRCDRTVIFRVNGIIHPLISHFHFFSNNFWEILNSKELNFKDVSCGSTGNEKVRIIRQCVLMHLYSFFCSNLISGTSDAVNMLVKSCPYSAPTPLKTPSCHIHTKPGRIHFKCGMLTDIRLTLRAITTSYTDVPHGCEREGMLHRMKAQPRQEYVAIFLMPLPHLELASLIFHMRKCFHHSFIEIRRVMCQSLADQQRCSCVCPVRRYFLVFFRHSRCCAAACRYFCRKCQHADWNESCPDETLWALTAVPIFDHYAM
ncbi:hypothetical protein F2P81_016657 [Scophthalmus maximus]|uniref:Uncharacterized protein n=1 Tax=Scophthalmus maximus TaxID=52904 RepID=A0A6A4SP40_SCOMX|nr:hypothetical protein F2P81_016657 [Scophthalmus maximus]